MKFLKLFLPCLFAATAFADRGPRDPTEGLNESGCGKDRTCVEKMDKFGGREVRDPTASGTERSDRVPDRTYHDDRGNHGTRDVGDSKQCKNAKSNRNWTAVKSVAKAAAPCTFCILSPEPALKTAACYSCAVAGGVGTVETTRSHADVVEACRAERSFENDRGGLPEGDGLPGF